MDTETDTDADTDRTAVHAGPLRHHLPVIQSDAVRPDGRRVAIQPADVRGRFARARMAVFTLLIATYVALPWITIGGHPAVFLDIERRSFYLFGGTFNAQDLWLTALLLLGVGFALVVITTVAGRVWCGWACPQTVFLDGVYRRVERWLQGSRARRLHRNGGPWTIDRLARVGATHAVWIAISLGVAHVFLSYFVSLSVVLRMVRGSPSAHPEAFALVLAVAGAMHVNFAWFREQTCVIVCPYGRLQSVLVDADSLVVGYDSLRGEPRGKAKAPGVGDCVDCKRCVTVCPNGIDIRNGLQLECITCTACIDACDDVMDRLGRPRGLIRYDSPHGLAGKPKRILRPRLFAYAALLVLGLAGAGFAVSKRAPFEANVLRPVGAPFVLTGDDIENTFTIHLVNKRALATTFTITPEPIPGVTFTPPLPTATLGAMANTLVTVRVRAARAAYHGAFGLRFRVRGEGLGERLVAARFLGP